MNQEQYVKATPKSTIHPWKEDFDFQNIYSLVQNHTLVDEYRLYELWSLVQQVSHLDGDLLEVGAWRGGSAAVLLHAMQGAKTLYVADTFTGVVKAGKHDARYSGGEHADCSEETVRVLLSQESVHRGAQWHILRGIFPEKSAISIDTIPLCFCHIDVDVYASARDITNWVWPRLVTNGILVFDDYGFANCNGVRTWVDEFCNSVKIDAILIYNLNGHAVVIKR